jgi:hypothetical protein
MVEAAFLELPYPEAGVVDEDTLTEQTLALACSLPERPLVVGGCCCAHVGAVEALATRVGRLGIVWFDAHGDLNTPESSPSGNLWGMPLRMLIDSDTVAAEDVALVGARSLDPPEETFIVESGLRLGEEGRRAGARRCGRRLRRVRLRRARARLRRFHVHAGAGRDDSRGGRGRSRRAGSAHARRRAWLLRARPLIPRTSPGLARFCRAVGL